MADPKMKFALFLAATFTILLVGGRILILTQKVPASSDGTRRFAVPADDFSSVPQKISPKGSNEPYKKEDRSKNKAPDTLAGKRDDEIRSEAPSGNAEDFESWAVVDLQRRFGDAIQWKSRQAELLGLRKYMMVNYPEDWESKLYNILTRAFREHSDQILRTFSEFDRYRQWLEENAADLGPLGYENIKSKLDRKRREIFGQDAAELWPSRLRENLLMEVLDVLDHAQGISLEDKLSVYKDAVEDVYGRSDQSVGASYSQQLTSTPAPDNSYSAATINLNLDAVQEELMVMTVDDRANGAYRIRRQLGISDDTSEPFDSSDYRKEQQWRKGLSYMAEREALWQVHSGDELTSQLQQLRRRYFGDGAGAIAAEEAANFFRYSRKRGSDQH